MWKRAKSFFVRLFSWSWSYRVNNRTKKRFVRFHIDGRLRLLANSGANSSIAVVIGWCCRSVFWIISASLKTVSVCVALSRQILACANTTSTRHADDMFGIDLHYLLIFSPAKSPGHSNFTKSANQFLKSAKTLYINSCSADGEQISASLLQQYLTCLIKFIIQ